MRAHWTMAALLPLALIACGPGDSDGDGLDNKLEEEIGTNPELADSDGDGIGDMAEYEGATDPTKADTDGDGFDDGVELQEGTDATDPMSYVRGDDGVWPTLNALCSDDSSTGYAVGDRFLNLTGTDQYGADVELEQFCGNVMLIDYSAGWCGPCKSVAVTAEEEYRDLADKGFVIVHVMTGDWDSNEIKGDFLKEWADQYGLTFPVMEADNADTALSGLSSAGLYRNAIPFMMLVDQDLNIVQAETGGGSEARLLSTAETLLE